MAYPATATTHFHSTSMSEYPSISHTWGGAQGSPANPVPSDHGRGVSYPYLSGQQPGKSESVPVSMASPYPNRTESTHEATRYTSPALTPQQLARASTAQFAESASTDLEEYGSTLGHHQRLHQFPPSPVVSPPAYIPHATGDPSLPGQDYYADPSINAPWGQGNDADGNRFQEQPAGLNHATASQLTQRRRSSQSSHLSISPTSSDAHSTPTDTRARTKQSCAIPDCPYKAYYNVSEQEQMEYCGQGHELQAIRTGFAKPCVSCRGRPRRIGERVCSRSCREAERRAQQVQGTYYGVQVTRREPYTRQGPW
ncbi:hypothetical protein BC834DRAFT_900807 [Gloeopeniophorella convolvens]|nr:hypothetical protein BC834DRAFT_900807 [Gloeopeniophorella convolvens]